MTGDSVSSQRPAEAPGRRVRRAAGRRTRARASRAPRGAHLPYLAALALIIAALAWMWRRGTPGARGGTLALAGAMFVAALARLVLPESRAGMLASRGRFMDVATLAALAVGLLVAGLLLPELS